jgi:hypothetical protein
MYRIVCLVYKSLNSMTPDWCLSDRPEALQTWNCGYQNINCQSLGVDLNIVGHIFTICCHQRYDLRAHFLHSSGEHMKCFWTCLKMTLSIGQ